MNKYIHWTKCQPALKKLQLIVTIIVNRNYIQYKKASKHLKLRLKFKSENKN